MKKNDILNSLKLYPHLGWTCNPFVIDNANSFYNCVIENHNLTLAWVAVHKNIDFDRINSHHFKRNTSEENGIANSLPRMLFVTNDQRWFVSKLGDDCFTEVTYDVLLSIIVEELNCLLGITKKLNPDASIVRSLNINLYNIKAKFDNIPGLQPKLETYIKTAGEVCNITSEESEGKPYPMLSDTTQQLARYSKLMHEKLFRSLTIKQLNYLLSCEIDELYVDPFYKKNKLFICINKHYRIMNSSCTKPLFLIVDKYLDVKIFHPTTSTLENEILPNLLLVNKGLISEFLNRDVF